MKSIDPQQSHNLLRKLKGIRKQINMLELNSLLIIIIKISSIYQLVSKKISILKQLLSIETNPMNSESFRLSIIPLTDVVYLYNKSITSKNLNIILSKKIYISQSKSTVKALEYEKIQKAKEDLFDFQKEISIRISNIIYIEIAKKAFPRILKYSINIYFITFLVNNYNAQMHNYVVNSRKSSAFNSTISLIGTVKSDSANDKILEQTTQAIFTTQHIV